MKTLKKLPVVLMGVLLLSLLLVGTAMANIGDEIPVHIQNTCPDGGDWIKTDGINAQTYDYTAPAGKEVLATCYKAGTSVVYDPTSGEFASPVTSYHFESMVPNSTGNAFKDISHVSVKLGDAPAPPPPKSDFNLTSMCKLDANTGQMRIRNNSGSPQSYHLYKYGGGFDDSGTVPVGDTLIAVPWSSSGDTYKLEIAGYTFTKAIGSNPLCEPVYTYKAHQSVDCDGVHRVIHGYVDGEMDLDNWVLHDEFIPFTEDAHYETIPAFTVPLHERYGGDYTFEAVEEPTECHNFDLKIWSRPRWNHGCEGWEKKVNLRDDGHYVTTLYRETGDWNDPAHYEMIPASSWAIPAEYGGGTADFAEIHEPTECHNFIVRVSSQPKWNHECESWIKKINLFDGGDFVEVLFVEEGDWNDPAHYEVIPASTEPIPDEYGGGTAEFGEIHEPDHCHEFTIRAFTKANCDWGMQKVNLQDFGQWVEVLHVNKVTWSDPFGYETIPADTYVAPAEYGGGEYELEEVVEPMECHAFHDDPVWDADCDGWTRDLKIYDGSTLLDTIHIGDGSWADPYTLESVPELVLPPPEGGSEGFDGATFPELEEPAKCQIFKTYKAHQAYLPNNCEGIRRVVHLYEGPASDPYRDLVDWDFYDVKILFDDPLVVETIPGFTVDVPADYGEDHTFGPMTEPESCHAFTVDYDQGADCTGYFRYVKLYDGGVLVDTVLDESGVWTDKFVNETGLPEATVPVPADFGGAINFLALNEPTTCQQTHETEVWKWSDCFTWKMGYKLDGEKVTAFEGQWQDPYGPESVTETVVVPIPDGELGERVFEVTIVKDEDCIQCEKTIAYYQAFVRPTGAEPPEGYMQKPFGEVYCPVITTGPEDVPAEYRITSVCSICEEDLPPDGYVYLGTATADDIDPVYKVRCWNGSGYDTHYEWRGKVWVYGPDYDPMYTPEGRLVEKYPRCDGCMDWIREQAPDLFPEGYAD